MAAPAWAAAIAATAISLGVRGQYGLPGSVPVTEQVMKTPPRMDCPPDVHYDTIRFGLDFTPSPPSGRHGLGFGMTEPTLRIWPTLLEGCLADLGMLSP